MLALNLIIPLKKILTKLKAITVRQKSKGYEIILTFI